MLLMEMILTHRTLWTLTARSLVVLVYRPTDSIASIFIPDIINSRENEALGTIYLILLSYSLTLNKLLVLSLKIGASPSDLTCGIK